MMKIVTNQLAAVMRRIDRLESAAVDLAFAGSRDPDEREGIETEYQEARAEVTRYLSGLNLKTKS